MVEKNSSDIKAKDRLIIKEVDKNKIHVKEQFMYQTHEEFNMYVVDRKKFSNPWKAIFYHLPMMKNNKPAVGITGLAIIFSMFILFMFHPEKSSKIIGGTVCSLMIIFPFISAFLKYHSRLSIQKSRFYISVFRFTYYKGSFSDIFEIRRLKNWGGSIRVRTKGSSDISGFLIFSDTIPSVFKDIKIADGIYINMGSDQRIEA